MNTNNNGLKLKAMFILKKWTWVVFYKFIINHNVSLRRKQLTVENILGWFLKRFGIVPIR